MTDPTQRFSSRVDNYIKYRPGYPPAVAELLRTQCGLTRASIVADIGSGTGILTELLLKTGCQVVGVEPNLEMRKAAERLLGSHTNFRSAPGTAETTTLLDQSVDIITAGQAFHWFDRDKTRREFVRILRRGGWVVLIWNDRKTDAHPFLKAYEGFLVTFGTDYEKVNHKQIDTTVIANFFGSAPLQSTFPNEQSFDFEGLKGRLMSSSYVPDVGHPRHEPMLGALRELFDEYQTNGRVVFEYDTCVFYGRMQR